MDRKVAVYTGTRNLYTGMECSAKSLYAHTDVDEIWFLIEDDEFPTELPDYVHVKNISDCVWEWLNPVGPNMKSPFTYMALVRACLAFMPEFEDLDKILSLDCDVAFVKDCPEIFDLPVDDCYLSASVEPKKHVEYMMDYCNTGVALYNLGKLRDGKAEEVLHLVNVRKLANDVQDAFSLLCQGHIHLMPSKYNANPFTEPCNNPSVVHYAGQRNWMQNKPISNWKIVPWVTVEQNHRLVLESLGM